MLADSGFRPVRDGYAFPNYGASPRRPNLGSDELRQLFGDGVCAGFRGQVCVLSPPALAWMQQQNATMAAGHCVGLSVTALFFFGHLSSPFEFGAPAVPRLTIAHNQLLARAIAYGYAFQVLESVRRAEVSKSPHEVLMKLASALRTGHELYTLGFTQPDGSGGHAVTPYEIERVGPHRYAILVYDNNYPHTTQVVRVDTKTDTWSYKAAQTPNQPGILYTGNALTHSLLLLPTLPGLGVQPCPFCSPTTAAPTTAQPARAATGTAGYEAVRLQTVGRSTSHLLITDSRGRKVGFLHGRLIDQIPGARIVSLFVAGSRSSLGGAEPQYDVPTGQPYKIELTSHGTAVTTPASETSKASVTVLEPGFLAAVRGIKTRPGQRDQLTLPADGHAISFLPRSGGRQTPELVVGNANPGHNDHQWNITKLGTRPGERIPAALDLPKNSSSFSGVGTYDLSMDLVGNGVSVFAHRHFIIGPGVTAHLDYAHWSAGKSMPVVETKGGKVIRKLLLSDQPSSDTGEEFVPREPPPAPPEPQPPVVVPQPPPFVPPATATTLGCSPATVVVGQQTICTVAVSDLTAPTAVVPTGEVSFSSNTAGAFSSPTCTLSNGSCTVMYTPSAIGSGSHQLTATYGGDATHAKSGTTTPLVVTLRVTGTSIDCSPQEVAEDTPTTCTVTVSDTSLGTPNTPTGEVTLSADGSGDFSQTSCTLLNGSCRVTYTPFEVGSGKQEITANYGGDATHALSSGTTTVKIKGEDRTARGRVAGRRTPSRPAPELTEAEDLVETPGTFAGFT